MKSKSEQRRERYRRVFSVSFEIHCCVNVQQQQRPVQWAILRQKNTRERGSEEKNQLEASGGSLGSSVDSFVVSMSAGGSSGTVVGGVIGLVCSDLGAGGRGGGVGDLFAGEFRCCSSSYSLIRRFFNGWALAEAVDAEGETEEETGDGLFRFAGGSIIVGKDDSCWVSDEDESV